MDKTKLQFQLEKEMQKDNFLEVLRLWENFGDKKLDFTREVDRAICDAISTSYVRIGCHDEAMLYIDARIRSMKTPSGSKDRTSNHYENWDWYYSMKTNILFEEKKRMEQYGLTLEYKEYGGNKDLYLSILKLIEDEYYLKCIRPIAYKFSYGLSILVPFMVILNILFKTKLTTSIYYYLVICVGVLLLVLYLYYETVIKKISLFLFRLFVSIRNKSR